MHLQDKIALITGGGRGIGRAIALELSAEGAAVAINDIDGGRAMQVAREIETRGGNPLAVEADVSQKAQVDRMVEEVVGRFGRIDVLVNNAGIAPFIEFLDATEEVWDRTIAINTKGIFLASQAVGREMAKRGTGGRIINITSISGIRATDKLQVPYCVSKAGANMLTKAMALALAPHGITVNAILPGTIETDLNREILADEALRKGVIDRTPLGCLGRPEDIAKAVIYFASDESRWTTGSLLVVDGGFTV